MAYGCKRNALLPVERHYHGKHLPSKERALLCKGTVYHDQGHSLPLVADKLSGGVYTRST